MAANDANGGALRDPHGRFAEDSIAGVYDALAREIRRIDQLREADQRAVTDALTASKDAIHKAEENQRRVNEGQNEFRQQLKDQASTFVRREYLEGVIESLQRQIDINRDARVGLVGSLNTWKWIAGFLGASGVAGVLYTILQSAPR